MNLAIVIDPEFRDLIPPLSADELAELRNSVLAEGIRDKLVVWDCGKELILVDGHHRLTLAQELSLPYEVHKKDFASRADAINWMLDNQLARRNLSPKELSYLRGKYYNTIKQAHGGAREASYQNDNLKSVQDVAAKTGVSTATISRDANYAKAVDVLAAKTGIAPHKVMDIVSSKQDVSAYAELPDNQAKRVLEFAQKSSQAGQSKTLIELTKLLTMLPASDHERATDLCENSVWHAQHLVKYYQNSLKDSSSDSYDEVLKSGGLAYGAEMELFAPFKPSEGNQDTIIKAEASKAEHAKKIAMEAKRQERIDKIIEGNKPLEAPATYSVLYCDPPWQYEHSISKSRDIENHYPTMDLVDICALPIQPIINQDAVLLMWATSPKLLEAMQVIQAWGFTYRTCAVWVKDKIGMGYYFRQRHELLLVASKGSLPVPQASNRYDSVIQAPRLEHSQKPHEIYEIIEEMYPEYPKVELFARNTRKDWFSWGNQV